MNLDVELSTVIDLLEKLKNKQQSIVNIQNSDHHRYTPNCPGTQTLVKQQSEWMLKKKKQSEWELLVMRQLVRIYQSHKTIAVTAGACTEYRCANLLKCEIKKHVHHI